MNRNEQEMYISIRQYYIIPEEAEKFLRLVQDEKEGFVPVIRQMPGFESYCILQVGADKVISVSLFHTLEGAEESVREAEFWVAEKVVHYLKRAPKIAVGPVIIYRRLPELVSI